MVERAAAGDGAARSVFSRTLPEAWLKNDAKGQRVRVSGMFLKRGAAGQGETTGLFVVSPAGETSASLIIDPIDDGEVEGVETVSIEALPDPAYELTPLRAGHVADMYVVDRHVGRLRQRAGIAVVEIAHGDELSPMVRRGFSGSLPQISASRR